MKRYLYTWDLTILSFYQGKSAKIFKKKEKRKEKPLLHRSKHLGSASHPDKFNLLSFQNLQNIKNPAWVISLIDPSLCSNPALTQPGGPGHHCNLLHVQLGHVSAGWDSEKVNFSSTHEYPRITLFMIEIPRSHRIEQSLFSILLINFTSFPK